MNATTERRATVHPMMAMSILNQCGLNRAEIADFMRLAPRRKFRRADGVLTSYVCLPKSLAVLKGVTHG